MRNDRKLRRVRNSQSKAIKRSRARRVTLEDYPQILYGLTAMSSALFFKRALIELPQESYAKLVNSINNLETAIKKFLKKDK